MNRYLDPFIMVPIGSVGTAGSSGGIRLTPDGAGERQTGPDVAIGDGQVRVAGRPFVQDSGYRPGAALVAAQAHGQQGPRIGIAGMGQ